MAQLRRPAEACMQCRDPMPAIPENPCVSEISCEGKADSFEWDFGFVSAICECRSVDAGTRLGGTKRIQCSMKMRCDVETLRSTSSSAHWVLLSHVLDSGIM